VIDLEREYSPSSMVGGSSDPFVAEYESRSAVVNESMGRMIERRPNGTLLLPAMHRAAPMLVFVHGGYWQALSAESSMYLAPAVHHFGWSYAAVEYTLAPGAPIEQMIAEVRAALADLASVGSQRVVVVGHSAGAHLAAMACLVHDPPLHVDTVVLISGVFDLRPLVHTTVNDALGLDDVRAAALSPQLLSVTGRARVVVTCGEIETDEFKRQSRDYTAHLRAHGLSTRGVESVGRHHFDIVDDVIAPDSPLGAAVLG
jgi:arylformamidase